MKARSGEAGAPFTPSIRPSVTLSTGSNMPEKRFVLDDSGKKTSTSSNLLKDAAKEKKSKASRQCYKECGLCCMPVETLREVAPERGVRDAARSLSAPGNMNMRRDVVTAGAERSKAATIIQQFVRGRSTHLSAGIRAALSNAGTPICDDVKYGSSSKATTGVVPFIGLHASTLECPHPVADKPPNAAQDELSRVMSRL